jgi:ectoine hydroxylase-related dioxygenase (phytanoyl-CoA dioxygenase family)
MTAHAPPDLALDLDVEAIRAAYARDGVVRLGKTVDDALLADLRARSEAIMRGEAADLDLFFQHDSPDGTYDALRRGEGWVGPSDRYRKIEKLERDPLFRALLTHPNHERIVRAFIEGPVHLYRAVLFHKAPGASSPIPWHQDGGSFWGLSEDPSLQIWTALDDAPEEAGCVEAIPGSHAGGLATPLGGVIPDDVASRANAEARAVPFAAKAGESLLIHNHVWHRSGANRSTKPRRGFTVCYLHAGVRCLRKKRAPRVFPLVFP